VRLESPEAGGGWWFNSPSWKRTVPLSPAELDLTAYRLVLFGGPIWYWRPDAVINSAIRSANLTGKNVVLFYTFEGGGMSQSTEAQWRAWVTERGGTVIDVVGIDRKRFSEDAALTAETARLVTERREAWLR
jgi:hypothetical protein